MAINLVVGAPANVLAPALTIIVRRGSQIIREEAVYRAERQPLTEKQQTEHYVTVLLALTYMTGQ